MLLGALVDVGVPLEVLQDAVDAVGTEPVRLTAETVTRHGLGALAVEVDVARAGQPASRTWVDVRALLERSGLDDEVRLPALDTFARLAEAEGAVHRVPADDVHFHEVGALDAVADVVGVSAGFAHLRAQGLERLVASRVTLGSGTARSGHGVLPVPGPAVLALLGTAGAPVWAGPVAYEMCTPTGAALLAVHVDGWGGLPPMTLDRTGHGAGSRDLVELPNLVRLVLGEPAGSASAAGTGLPLTAAGVGSGAALAVLLEANIDDLDPRLWPAALTALLAAGAADAWLTPITMKKGRPAHTLHVLCDPAALDAVRRAVFVQTSTIGLREQVVGKRTLERTSDTLEVDGLPVRVKTARLDGRTVNASLEYEDVAAAALALGVPVKVALARATAAAQQAGLLP